MSDSGPRILIVAGEASGDLHGGSLVRALRETLPGSRFFGMGGNRMRDAGVETLFDIDRMGAVGVFEFLGDFAHYLKVYRTLVDEIVSKKYSAAILIDYPTLNLRLARHCRQQGCPVYFVISPQIWAWRKGRIRHIRRDVTRMYVVLPFEESIYRQAGVDVEFVGHPFVDHVFPSMTREESRKAFGLDSQKPIVGILPGSRQNEIRSLLGPLLDAARAIREQIPDCQFILPVAETLDPAPIRALVESAALGVRVVTGRSYDVMNSCDCLMVASGSATLEAGVLGCPMVIVYKFNILTYILAKLLVRIENFGLVNIVAGERVAPELLQGEVTGNRVAREVLSILQDPVRREHIASRLGRLRESLGEPGVMTRVARSIAQNLERRADP
ncbi:MAG: lipid-A-disaccharide synthase [Nitrospinae bacterium CG11_big_fil_rev_8_21_14_0_20_56_8]|nr:MAG: lipid-A-disaccharide synthase [Nitrospinae bacterium CG11_big_fil_rev_8_21_14_0_20_56_8]